MNAQLNAREKDMKIKHLLLIILILSTLTLLFSCVGNQNIGTNQGGEPKQYVVTFDADGGTSVEAQVVEENKKELEENRKELQERDKAIRELERKNAELEKRLAELNAI